METLLMASRDAAILAVVMGGLLLAAGRRIPAGWRHGLWLLVAVRLLMPALPTSPVSWRRILPVEVKEQGGSSAPMTLPVVVSAVPDPLRPERIPQVSQGPLVSSEVQSKSVGRFPETWTIWEIVAGIWVSGVAGILTLGLFLTWRFGSRLKKLAVASHPKQTELEVLLETMGREYGWRKMPRVEITEAVEAPALFGIFHPRILMPPTGLERLSETELRLVLLHELGHWRRRDLWVNFTLALLQAVHWFNPLVWWAFHRTRVESEQATDTWVLQRAGVENVTNYGEMLLRLLDQSTKPRTVFPGIVSVVESPQDLQRRMVGIGRFTGKCNRWAVCGSAAILLGFAAVGLTQPPKQAEEPDMAKTPAADTFTCRVLSPEGTPAADAEVYFEVTEHIEGRPVGAVALAGKTDAAGGLKIAIRPEWGDTTNLSVQLIVRHAQHGYGGVSTQMPSAESTKEVKLTHGFPLRFSILDENRKPISNLRLRVVTAETPSTDEYPPKGPRLWGAIPQLPKGFWDAVTDEEGRCSIEGLPPGRYYVDHEDPKYGQVPGRLHYAFQHKPETQKEEIEVLLHPGAKVWGTVRLPDGTPVSGAKVVILENFGYQQGGLTDNALTDAKGQYELQRLLPAEYALQVSLNDKLQSDWTSNPIELRLNKGELRKEVNPVILKGGLIRGKITLADTGMALADTMVSAVPSKGSLPLAEWWTTSDRNGRFQLRVPVGARKVYFAGMVPEGYASSTKDSMQLEVNLNVEEGGNYTADFAIPRAPSISGVVVSASGQPVAGANVTCLSPMLTSLGTHQVVTDALGKFSFALPAGVEKEGLLAEFENACSPNGMTYPVGSDVILKLDDKQFASASGRVVDIEGRPIAAAKIWWDGEEAAGVPVRATTDEDGRFHVNKVLPSDQIIFYGSKKGYGENNSFAGFKAGQSVELEPIVLQIADETLIGKVVDAAGSPVADAKVGVSSEFQPNDVQAISDSEGKFVLKGLVKGWLFVQVTKQLQGGDMFSAEVRVNTSAGEVVVKPSDRPGPWKLEKLIDLVGKPAPPLKAQSWFHTAGLPENQPGKVRLISIVGLDRSLTYTSDTLPILQKFRKEIPEKDLEIIVVHGAWPREEIAEILAKEHPDFSLPLAIEAEKGAMSTAFGAQSWLTVVIDKEGKVVFQDRGQLGKAKKKVMELLGREK